MPDERILTIDIGTSSVRALFYDLQARAIPGLVARRPFSMRTTPEGGVEGDAPFLLRLVEEVVDEVLHKSGRVDVLAGACCTFWHSLLGLDQWGQPMTPVYTWADTRSESQADDLKRRMDEKAYHARTGAFFHPLYWPAKLLWAGGHRAARWVSFGEFLYEKLFGRATVTISMASGTGLLDTHLGRFDPAILREVGLKESQLSPLVDLRDLVRGLREPYGTRWPPLREVPWLAPVGDGACNNLGSGCVSQDRIGVMVGTSGAMRVVWDTPTLEIPPGLWCYRVDRARAVLGGALNDGGNLVEWCRNTFRLGEPDAVERELAAMDPDAHGLTFLPFLAGERSTGWAAHARAVISGLRLNSRPVEILRAGMEAVALRFAMIYELMPRAKEIVASGGALLHSPAWVRMLADAIGRPILPSLEPEASSRGAALLALEVLGKLGDLRVLPAQVGDPVVPDPSRHATYQNALARQKALYDQVVKR
jgi:gluconokinase